MARTKKTPEVAIFWREGRAYGDFRAYEDIGGKREALKEPGTGWGTEDEEIARILFRERLEELQAKRLGRAGGPDRRSTRLDRLVRDHLVKKKLARRTSDSHLIDLDQRLRVAVEHFGPSRDPRTIEPADVRQWVEKLSQGGKRKPGTVRHYLNALSGLYGRAQESLYVDPKYNPVQMLQEKPSGYHRGEAAFLEVHDAALLLESARILEAREKLPPGQEGGRSSATPGIHAIVATCLLTGGRASEVLGLDVEDVSFDRGLIHFRPNEHRGLKTRTSVRTVPLWPQLREVLHRHMYTEGGTARGSGLLFPGRDGSRVRDLRKSLDDMARLCGMEPGEVRTRRFRQTYCSARLQTVQRIAEWRDPDAWCDLGSRGAMECGRVRFPANGGRIHAAPKDERQPDVRPPVSRPSLALGRDPQDHPPQVRRIWM